MKLNCLSVCILLLSMVVVSCDDTTDTIGQSLTDNMDHVKIYTDTFTVSTQSIKAGPVLSRTVIGNLGRLKDPDTDSYISSDFTTKFHVLSNYSILGKDSVFSYKTTGEFMADSCELRFYFSDYVGDSLATMKATLYELDKPLKENESFYSDFDPLKEGYVRTDANAIKIGKSYTLSDYTIQKSEREAENHAPNICFVMKDPYTDKEGNTYPNYATYILRKAYEHPEYFKNSQTFANHVCPGFYLKTESGFGSMAYIYGTNMSIYYKGVLPSDSTFTASIPFSGTEEVIQHTTISNENSIDKLLEDKTCTYLKTPAGIFTEVTIPVDEIMLSHGNDTLNTAKISFTRLNNRIQSDYSFDVPTNLLLIQKDSLQSYFENGKTPDNKVAFLISASSTNDFEFSNIAEMIRFMYEIKLAGKASENWNKAVLVPVDVNFNTSNTQSFQQLTHQMSVTSTRLVGGSENPNGPIKLSVIYSKFSD